MNRFGNVKAKLAVILSSGISCSLVRISKCDQSEQHEHPPESESDRYVAISLATKSQNDLKEYLEKQQLGSFSSKLVIIKPLSINIEDQYVYEPLFGERAAFRLKGVAKTKNGLTMGFGRVSTFAGEVKDDDVSSMLIPIVPLAPSESDLNSLLIDESLELAKELVSSGAVTNLPSSSLSSSTDLSISTTENSNTLKSVSSIIFPFSQQIILEGRICRSDLFDEDGSCLFDRSQIQSSRTSSSSPSSSSIPSTDDGTTIAHSSSSTEEVSECPICKFMKNGQCKEEFLKWDECVSALKEDEDVGKCFKVTVAMMKCMKQYEYYDIMTAGTNYQTE